ncbi:MAG: MotA/TolQ/ExbB proton channel family protein [Bdellovibrionales bacterium]|nr:MotA/TolQ/ExbB proton channel family protein [Bdellovibrionales bacterium]
MEMLFKIADASAHGILYFMGLLSLISVTIMVERYLFLKQIGAKSTGMTDQFRKLIAGSNLAQVESLAKDENSIEGKALGFGMTYVKNHGSAGLDEFFNSFKSTEKPSLERNLNILGTIASNAPYIGLLGTVMGIMKAFNDLAVAPGQGNEVVMAGIGHALVSTAIGLAVAIPAVVAFNLFQKKVGLVLENIDAARDLCLAYTKSRKG